MKYNSYLEKTYFQWKERARRGDAYADPLLKALRFLHQHQTSDLVSAPEIIDLTFGLGSDAMKIMAAFDVDYRAYERVQKVYDHVLADISSASESFQTEMQNRLRLKFANFSVSDIPLSASSEKTTVLYYDPMYSDDRSALPKSPMQWLKKIVGADSDASEMTSNLLAVRGRFSRLIVKRHDKAPLLADDPNFQISSKTVRFDVY